MFIFEVTSILVTKASLPHLSHASHWWLVRVLSEYDRFYDSWLTKNAAVAVTMYVQEPMVGQHSDI